MSIGHLSHCLKMSTVINKNSPLISPLKLRIIFFLVNLLICWGAVLYKARQIESPPWTTLLIVTVFILVIFAIEVLFYAWFFKYLAPAVYGFLFGAGINVIFQGLLNGFQGLTWAFQSPILFSLGMLLFGFLGTLLFVVHEKEFNRSFPWDSFFQTHNQIKGNLRFFIATLWMITAAAAIGLCVNLYNILKVFRSLETDNPLRKPLWFSVGTIIFVFFISAFARKKLLSLGIILLPGMIVGLIWASIFRDMFGWLYLKYPEFPLHSEILELLLVINLCFLGTSWLYRAVFRSQQEGREKIS